MSMTIGLEPLAWGALGVLVIWAIAKICVAGFESATEKERLRIRHQEHLALAREETLRLQTVARALGVQAVAPVPPIITHPPAPPVPPRPPA